MGQLPSKLNQKKIGKNKLMKFRFKRKKKTTLKDLKVPELPHDFSSMNEIDDDIEAKRQMQDQLAFNSDIFVLNQMMMSVQFFGNFER